MVKINNGVATTSVGSHLIQTIVFVTKPIVTLRVLADTIETAKGLTATIVGQCGTAAIVTDEEERALLVTNEQQVALFVIKHGSRLILQGRRGIGYQHGTLNSLL